MKTNKGETALHLVAASCCPQRILLAFQFLLDHGADPTLKDASEKTVLYYVFERKEIKQETRLAITKLLRPDFGSRSGCASGSSLGGGRCDSESELSLIGSDQPIMSPSEKMSVDFSDSALGSVGSPGVSSRPDLFQVPLQPTNQTARYRYAIGLCLDIFPIRKIDYRVKSRSIIFSQVLFSGKFFSLTGSERINPNFSDLNYCSEPINKVRHQIRPVNSQFACAILGI